MTGLLLLDFIAGSRPAWYQAQLKPLPQPPPLKEERVLQHPTVDIFRFTASLAQ